MFLRYLTNVSAVQRSPQAVYEHAEVGHAPLRRAVWPEALHHLVTSQAVARSAQQPLEQGATLLPLPVLLR